MKGKKKKQSLATSNKLINAQGEISGSKQTVEITDRLLKYFDDCMVMDFSYKEPSISILNRIRVSLKNLFGYDVPDIVAKELFWLKDAIQTNDMGKFYSINNYAANSILVKNHKVKLEKDREVKTTIKKAFDRSQRTFDDESERQSTQKAFAELLLIPQAYMDLLEKYEKFHAKNDTSLNWPEIQKLKIQITTNFGKVESKIKGNKGLKYKDVYTIQIFETYESEQILESILEGIKGRLEPVSKTKQTTQRSSRDPFRQLVIAIDAFVDEAFNNMTRNKKTQMTSWILAECNILMSQKLFNKVIKITEEDLYQSNYMEYLKQNHPLKKLRKRQGQLKDKGAD